MARLVDPKGWNEKGEMIGKEVLECMRRLGGRWAAYQNHDLCSGQTGHIRFLAVGPGKSYSEPPQRFPDTREFGVGWRYVYVGEVDIATGKIIEGEWRSL